MHFRDSEPPPLPGRNLAGTVDAATPLPPLDGKGPRVRPRSAPAPVDIGPGPDPKKFEKRRPVHHRSSTLERGAGSAGIVGAATGRWSRTASSWDSLRGASRPKPPRRPGERPRPLPVPRSPHDPDLADHDRTTSTTTMVSRDLGGGAVPPPENLSSTSGPAGPWIERRRGPPRCPSIHAPRGARDSRTLVRYPGPNPRPRHPPRRRRRRPRRGHRRPARASPGSSPTPVRAADEGGAPRGRGRPAVRG